MRYISSTNLILTAGPFDIIDSSDVPPTVPSRFTTVKRLVISTLIKITRLYIRWLECELAVMAIVIISLYFVYIDVQVKDTFVYTYYVSAISIVDMCIFKSPPGMYMNNAVMRRNVSPTSSKIQDHASQMIASTSQEKASRVTQIQQTRCLSCPRRHLTKVLCSHLKSSRRLSARKWCRV